MELKTGLKFQTNSRKSTLRPNGPASNVDKDGTIIFPL